MYLSNCCNEKFGLYINNLKQGFCYRCNKLSCGVKYQSACISLSPILNSHIRFTDFSLYRDIQLINKWRKAFFGYQK